MVNCRMIYKWFVISPTESLRSFTRKMTVTVCFLKSVSSAVNYVLWGEGGQAASHHLLQLKKVYCSLTWFTAASLRFTAPHKVDCTNFKRFSSSFNNWEKISEKSRAMTWRIIIPSSFVKKNANKLITFFSSRDSNSSCPEIEFFSRFLPKISAASQGLLQPPKGLLHPHKVYCEQNVLYTLINPPRFPNLFL